MRAPRGFARYAVVLAAVWILSMAYMWLLLDRAWVPHDEGALGQSALRVLRGELPHRDFGEIYTGGLTYLNALSFQLWGVRLIAMRYMAYLAFACWIPVVYYLASGWGPGLAGAITLTAVAWSYPNYPAAMPSWYTLYCATGTVACLARYLDVRRTRWLVTAGALAGISCLFKIVGLYVVAGALLFLVHLEQRDSAAAEPEGTRAAGTRWYPVVATAGLVAFGASVYLLVRPRVGPSEFVQFVLPSWASVAFLLVGQWTSRRVADGRRFRAALGLMGPFAAGFALPIVAMLGYFLARGGLDGLLVGVLVTPFRRVTTAAWRPPPLAALLPTLLVALTLGLGERVPRTALRWDTIVPGVLLATLLAVGAVPGLGQLGYLSLSQAVPLIVIASLLVVRYRAGRGKRECVGPECLALLAFMCATYTLVQYPFYNTTYFTYIAPLVLLTGASVMGCLFRDGRPRLAALLLFYSCYAILWLTPWQYRLHNEGTSQRSELRTLLPGRADIRVAPRFSREYQTLVSLIASKARSEFIWAGPDCPEVYFLSGRTNPTGTLFDFLDRQSGRTARILSTLEQRGVRLVVVKQHPLFSAPLDAGLADALRARYPHDSVIGDFLVRWN